MEFIVQLLLWGGWLIELFYLVNRSVFNCRVSVTKHTKLLRLDAEGKYNIVPEVGLEPTRAFAS